MQPKLGILAGAGSLPEELIAACRDQDRPFHVIAFEGQTPKESLGDGIPHDWVRLGAAGRAIDILRNQGVEELVMAGTIQRPSIATLFPDAWTAAFFARHGMAVLGDDGLLSALVEDLETREGFRIVGAEALLPDVLVPSGLLAGPEPDEQAMADIRRGIEVARGIGSLDVGQGCVVQQGLVLAVEAIEGTDEMLARVGQLRRGGVGGVLVKVAKPDQELRADLPTIGTKTVKNASQAGLRGIAVEAGRAVILDRSGVVDAAEQAGLFILGLDDV